MSALRQQLPFHISHYANYFQVHNLDRRIDFTFSPQTTVELVALKQEGLQMPFKRGRPADGCTQLQDWVRVQSVLKRPGNETMTVSQACRIVLEEQKPDVHLDRENILREVNRCNSAETIRARYNDALRLYRRDLVVQAL